MLHFYYTKGTIKLTKKNMKIICKYNKLYIIKSLNYISSKSHIHKSYFVSKSKSSKFLESILFKQLIIMVKEIKSSIAKSINFSNSNGKNNRQDNLNLSHKNRKSCNKSLNINDYSLNFRKGDTN